MKWPLGPYVIVTKPGYRKNETRLFDDAGLNTITMSVADDSGYFRENEVRFDVDSIDTAANRIHVRRSDAHCEGNQLVPENTSGALWYGLAEGKLYLRMEAECQGMRLGGSKSLLGDWSVEDRAAEFPPSIRPATCPEPLPGSRPLDPPSAGVIRIRSLEMVWWSYAEQCPGGELYYKVRNHFWSDPEVKMTESRCRYTAFSKAQTTAKVEYIPFGSRESTMVAFTYQGKRCSYVDPLASDDPPKQCPDPSERAFGEFLACIDSSGFAKPAGSLPKRSAMEKPALSARDRKFPAFGELLRYLGR